MQGLLWWGAKWGRAERLWLQFSPPAHLAGCAALCLFRPEVPATTRPTVSGVPGLSFLSINEPRDGERSSTQAALSQAPHPAGIISVHMQQSFLAITNAWICNENSWHSLDNSNAIIKSKTHLGMDIVRCWALWTWCKKTLRHGFILKHGSYLSMIYCLYFCYLYQLLEYVYNINGGLEIICRYIILCPIFPASVFCLAIILCRCLSVYYLISCPVSKWNKPVIKLNLLGASALKCINYIDSKIPSRTPEAPEQPNQETLDKLPVSLSPVPYFVFSSIETATKVLSGLALKPRALAFLAQLLIAFHKGLATLPPVLPSTEVAGWVSWPFFPSYKKPWPRRGSIWVMAQPVLKLLCPWLVPLLAPLWILWFNLTWTLSSAWPFAFLTCLLVWSLGYLTWLAFWFCVLPHTPHLWLDSLESLPAPYTQTACSFWSQLLLQILGGSQAWPSRTQYGRYLQACDKFN